MDTRNSAAAVTSMSMSIAMDTRNNAAAVTTMSIAMDITISMSIVSITIAMLIAVLPVAVERPTSIVMHMVMSIA